MQKNFVRLSGILLLFKVRYNDWYIFHNKEALPVIFLPFISITALRVIFITLNKVGIRPFERLF